MKRDEPRLTIARLAGTWLLTLVLASLAGCGLGRHPLEGEEAPAFQLRDLAGASHTLREWRGRETILVFWLDCPVCRAELPLLQSLFRRSSKELQIVGVNSHQPAEEVAAMARQLELGFPLLLDPGGQVEGKYHVVTAPTAFHLDAQGRVVEAHIGKAGYQLALKIRQRQQGR